jgi:hypothetical protein
MQAFTEVVPRGFAKVAGKIRFYLHRQAGKGFTFVKNS